MERMPSVAGMFYPGNPEKLRQTLEAFFEGVEVTGNALGIVSPHAGYVYSGKVATDAFAALPRNFSGTIIIIGPSHAGYSTSASSRPWKTPLGTVEVDRELLEFIDIPVDELSHRDEHSIEVQLPFVQYHAPEARIVPIMMGNQRWESADLLAVKIAGAVERLGHDVRIVASSDFSHYVPEEEARERDLYAIDALTTLDTAEFFRRIMERRVSACGYGPITAMVEACKRLGAERGELLRYTTSAEATGDTSQVVGYAAIAVI
ncbi:MAG: MEMO1 family protein [Methanomicrobiaceae archaeon]|nr:MEMO1 family protein [Methanomicrobiaceae archaeon]